MAPNVQAMTEAKAAVPTEVDAGPLAPDQLIPTLLMFAIAAAGGFVAFYRKWKDGSVRAFNLTELIGELVVSGLCGIGAYWVCRAFQINPWMTAALVGMVGHMGSRAIFMFEQWAAGKAGLKLPDLPIPKEPV